VAPVDLGVELSVQAEVNATTAATMQGTTTGRIFTTAPRPFSVNWFSLPIEAPGC
jgi:hypothetical protein